MRSSIALFGLLAVAGCHTEEAEDGAVKIGVLLSYSGYLAANSANSERALLMAVEGANAAGGVQGRRVRLLARDTRSDPAAITRPAGDLLAAGVSMFIGPDTPELAVPLVTPLRDQAIILPSSFTAHSPFRRPPGWFVMGGGTAVMACELEAELQHQGRKKPVVLVDGNGYDGLIAWELTRRYGIPQVVLPPSSDITTLQPVIQLDPDAIVLSAQPSNASSLVFAMAALGQLEDPTRWYLGPTLHTPAFLETIPKGLLAGARGVAPGTIAGAADFRTRFSARWQDTPLDDAYSFYDAGAIAVLALQRAALRNNGAIPPGPTLVEHIVAVTHAGGTPVRWNELDRGLQLLGSGQEIEYIGVTGVIEFDLSGQTSTASTTWWTIGAGGFEDVERMSDCLAGRL